MSQTVTTKTIAKVAAVATGLAMGVSMLTFASNAYAAGLTASQVQSILSLLSSFGADSATIANVNAALTGGTMTTTTTSGGSCSFTRDLTIGSSGADVTALQNWLISKGYSIPAGATGHFGPQTQAAVIAWQKAAGVSPAAGYFGAKSRAAANCTTTTTTTTGGTVPVGSGNGLKVALSATSPSGSVLVQGQGIGDLADFTFSNPTSAPITVTGLTFNRIGVSNDSTINNVYLYNGVNRITDSAGVSSGQFSFTNAAGIFVVGAGQTYTVSVRADIATGTSGQQIGASLVSVASSGTLDSSDSFPINSGYQTISAANLAGVDYNATTLPSAATSISPQSAYPVWQNTVNVSTNPVKLESVKFTNLGSIDASYLANLALYVDGTQVGTTIPSMTGNTVVFDLSANPKLLSQAGHVIKLLADITGGASRTVQFSVQRSSDAMFVDNQLGQPVTPTLGGATFGAVTAKAITINSVNGSSGVSVTTDPASPTSNVAVGATNVKWASFDFLASGEPVKVSDLYVYADDTGHTTSGLANGKIFVNGVQVGSTKNLGSSSGTHTDFSLGSSMILPAGVTTHVDIYADAKTSTSTNLASGDTVTLYFDAATANAQGQNSLQSANVPASAVHGNTITVTSSTITATKYTGYGNQNVIPGSNNAKLGAFTLSTGSTEGVTVNTVLLNLTSNNAASITNLWLKDDSVAGGCTSTAGQLGSVITTPSTANSYSINTDIPASGTKTIDVCGNVLSGSNIGPFYVGLDDTTGGVGDVTGTSAQIATSNTAAATDKPAYATLLQTITVGAGKLSDAVGAGDPVSTNVIAGSTSLHVGQFQFAAQNSSYTVQNLAVLVPVADVNNVTNITVQYKDVNGNTQSATTALASSGVSGSNATATFTGLTYYVPANDSSVIDVYAGVPTIASGATSGGSINVKIDGIAANSDFKAVDSSGSALTAVNTTGTGTGVVLSSNGTFYVRKSIPTFAMLSNNSSSPTNPLYRFSITADPAGAVEWTQLKFTIATTSATVSSVTLVDESTGNNVLDGNATTSTTAITANLLSNAVQPNYQQVAAGSTKTYDLDGTVTGFTTGSTITIYLTQDTGTTPAAVNTASAQAAYNLVWSDRSANAHSTGTSDWTNGVLVKNYTNNQVSYSK